MLQEVQERLRLAGYEPTRVCCSDYVFEDGSPGLWVTFTRAHDPDEHERDLVALHALMETWKDYASALAEPPKAWNLALTHVGIFAAKRPL